MILKDKPEVSVATVLVVSDSRLIVAVLAKGLGTRVRLLPYRSGEQALERLLLDPEVDAVVCDNAIAQIGPEDLPARMRRAGPPRVAALPLIVIGGNDDPVRAREVLAAGADAYVPKTRVAVELVPAVENLLRAGPLAGALRDEGEDDTDITSIQTVGEVPEVHGVSRGGMTSIGSVIRLRWQIRPVPGAGEAAQETARVNQQVLVALEGQLRSRDRWLADHDGSGGVLGLNCAIEDALRPVLRLAAGLNDAADRLDQEIAIAMRLYGADTTVTMNLDFEHPPAWPDALEMPGPGEIGMVLAGTRYRLKLNAAGRG